MNPFTTNTRLFCVFVFFIAFLIQGCAKKNQEASGADSTKDTLATNDAKRPAAVKNLPDGKLEVIYVSSNDNSTPMSIRINHGNAIPLFHNRKIQFFNSDAPPVNNIALFDNVAGNDDPVDSWDAPAANSYGANGISRYRCIVDNSSSVVVIMDQNIGALPPADLKLKKK